MCRSGGVRGWGREAGGARVFLWKFQTYFIHINNSKIINNNKNETDLSPLFREIYFSPRFAPPKINLFSSNLIHHKKKKKKIKYVIQRLLQDRI